MNHLLAEHHGDPKSPVEFGKLPRDHRLVYLPLRPVGRCWDHM